MRHSLSIIVTTRCPSIKYLTTSYRSNWSRLQSMTLESKSSTGRTHPSRTRNYSRLSFSCSKSLKTSLTSLRSTSTSAGTPTSSTARNIGPPRLTETVNSTWAASWVVRFLRTYNLNSTSFCLTSPKGQLERLTCFCCT